MQYISNRYPHAQAGMYPNQPIPQPYAMPQPQGISNQSIYVEHSKVERKKKKQISHIYFFFNFHFSFKSNSQLTTIHRRTIRSYVEVKHTKNKHHTTQTILDNSRFGHGEQKCISIHQPTTIVIIIIYMNKINYIECNSHIM